MNLEKELNTKSLEAWREEIDRLDAQLLRLLSERAQIACKIGQVKVARGLPAYDGRRERAVLARIRAQNSGPFSADSVTRIFRRIIVETRKIGTLAMQKQIRKQERTEVEEHSNGYQHGSRRV